MSDKKMYSCYVEQKHHAMISSAGPGGFSAGITYCAKNFAKYAKGSDNYAAASFHIRHFFTGGKSINLSELYNYWFTNGYHLPNLLICLSQLFLENCLTIDSEMNISRTSEDWLDTYE